MSRHRTIRKLDINEVRDDDLYYGQSVEEDVPPSPSTEQFIYRRHRTSSSGAGEQHNLGDFIPSEPAVPEEAAYGYGDGRNGCGGGGRRPYEEEDYCDDGDVFDFDDVGFAAKKKPAAGDKKGGGNNTNSNQSKAKAAGQTGPASKAPAQGGPKKAGGRQHKKPAVVRLDDEHQAASSSSAAPVPPLSVPEVAALRLEAKPKCDRSRSPSPGDSTRTPTPTGNKRSGAATPVYRAKQRSRPAGARPLLNLVVVGHVDAGKSTLLGHLLCQVGGVGQRAMHKFKSEAAKAGKGSFAYAWVLDETSEERQRGITMDIAHRTFDTSTKRVHLLDAPGHKDFIPMMITGASGADAAVLVVNATRGEFETGFELGGQTREHAMLVRSLGVSQLIVAVNKMDTVDFDQARFDELRTKLTAFLVKQAGFAKGIPFIPVSGLMGVNLSSRVPAEHELALWYDGQCLLEAIDAFKPSEHESDERPLRMVVSDVHRSQGGNVTLAGKVELGTVECGDRVVLLPSNTLATVKGVSPSSTSVNAASDDADAQYLSAGASTICYCGEHCLVTLGALSAEATGLAPGDVLCHPDHEPLAPARKFTLKLVVFEPATPLTKGCSVELHAHNVCEPAVLKRLRSQLNKTTGEVVRDKPRCLVKHSTGVVDVETARPVCLEAYASCRELGRVTLRAHGRTIAAGLVQRCRPDK